MERLKDVVTSVFPITVKIEWVPILVGALFKEIGTPVVSEFFLLWEGVMTYALAALVTNIIYIYIYPRDPRITVVCLPFLRWWLQGVMSLGLNDEVTSLISLSKVPAAAMNPTKRDYHQKDLLDWCSYAQIKLRWPDTFPIRSVLPLRVTLAANCDPALIAIICKSY